MGMPAHSSLPFWLVPGAVMGREGGHGLCSLGLDPRDRTLGLGEEILTS